MVTDIVGVHNTVLITTTSRPVDPLAVHPFFSSPFVWSAQSVLPIDQTERLLILGFLSFLWGACHIQAMGDTSGVEDTAPSNEAMYANRKQASSMPETPKYVKP